MPTANKVSIIRSSGLAMSSREISDLTEKRHDNVLRDIERMLTDLGESLLKFEETYINPQNLQTYRCYFLPKDLTLTLVSGYNVKLRKKIIDRWMELEGGRETKVAPPRLRRPSVLRTFKTAIEIGKLAGLEDNMLALHAGCYCKAKCGENPLELMDPTPTAY